MFLRGKSKKYRGVGYRYWHLCETTRTARGPRQRVVASLGKLDAAELAGLRGGREDLPALLPGETPSPRPATAPLPGLETPAPPPAQWEQAERIWVMDRGMVSEANLGFLRERKARYLVGTPKSWLRHHEAALLEQTDWKKVQDGLEVRLVAHPDGQTNEKYVLCRSSARAQKEQAMLQRQSDGLTSALIKIDAWLRRSPQTDHENVGRRIGRSLGKYPAAAAIVNARVQTDARGQVCAVEITSEPAAGQKAFSAPSIRPKKTRSTKTWRRPASPSKPTRERWTGTPSARPGRRWRQGRECRS